VLDGELHLLNSSDVTYAVVRPDARSQEIMFDRVAELPDPLSRAVVINTATQLLLLGELAPRIAAKAATKALASEPVAGLAESFASQGYLFADRWAPGAESAELKAALAEASVLGLVLAAQTRLVHRDPQLALPLDRRTRPDRRTAGAAWSGGDLNSG
jgi:aminopeptidase N